MQIFGEIMRRKLVAKGKDGNARQYIERRILTPLGVTIGSWRSDPDGAPLMPQGLALAASAWAKIGEFVRGGGKIDGKPLVDEMEFRSEEHTSELQSLMRISYAVFCLKTKKKTITI